MILIVGEMLVIEEVRSLKENLKFWDKIEVDYEQSKFSVHHEEITFLPLFYLGMLGL